MNTESAQLTSEAVLTYLTENKGRLQSDYHLIEIGIFGSFARGDQSSSSDIDLIVEFTPGTHDLHSLKLRLKEEIQSVFHRPVDICRRKYIKPAFRNQILADTRYA